MSEQTNVDIAFNKMISEVLESDADRQEPLLDILEINFLERLRNQSVDGTLQDADQKAQLKKLWMRMYS